jgi:hypothetical protein
VSDRRHAAISRQQRSESTSRTGIFCRDWPAFYDRIAKLTCQFEYLRSRYEFAVAGAAKVAGLVKSPGLVVGFFDPG